MLGIKVSPEMMRRFWRVLTHSHGSVSNLSDIGRSLGISCGDDILHHLKLEASWKGFALEQAIKYSRADSQDCYFGGIHSQNELDLMIIKDGKRVGYELKFSDKVEVTKSMRAEIKTLSLGHFTIVFPGKNRINSMRRSLLRV